jgi:peptide/nickel transport system permease protein
VHHPTTTGWPGAKRWASLARPAAERVLRGVMAPLPLFVLRRLAQAVLVALASSAIIFLLLLRIPGDPALAIAGPDAPPEAVAAIRHEFALDQPVPVQYVRWLSHILHGDLGVSILSRQPVTALIAHAFPATLQLAAASSLLTIVGGVGLGVLAAWRRGSLVDTSVSVLSSFAIGLASFWLGTVMLYVFVIEVPWFPPGGWVDVTRHPLDGLRSLALPSIVLAVVESAVISRFVRASVVEALSQDYVRTARAKGLSEALILWRYGVRNALIPVVTVLGLMLGNVLGGVIVLEIVFSWPGLGMLLVNAVGERDYPVIQGVLLVLIAVFIAVNLVVDVLYQYIDPRTRR